MPNQTFSYLFPNRAIRSLAKLIVSKLMLLATALACLAATPVISGASVTFPLRFSWDYDPTIPDLAGYIIYKDGIALQQIWDPMTLNTNLNVSLRRGVNTFTVSAFNSTGTESPQSNPFYLDLPPQDASGNLLPMTTFFASSVYSVIMPFSVTFDASGSTDLDGLIVDYRWDFGDGQIGFGQVISHTYYSSGIYLVSLTTTDNSGAQNTALLDVFVGAENSPALMGQDNDLDGLTNLEEHWLLTDPYIEDTDADGVLDGFDGAPLDYWSSRCTDLVRNDKMGSTYASITDAYYEPELLDGDTIEVTAADLVEGLLLDRPVAITLAGGFFCNFSDNPARTTIRSLTISHGNVTLENIVIQ